MRTIHLLIGLLLLSNMALAQPAQKEINEQVWKPFIAAFNDLDPDAFMALHSHDLVRALRDDGRVMGYDEYAKVTASGNHNVKINKFQKKLELRFSERWVNHDLAYEVGIYKSQTIKPSGNNIISYGKFQVVLRQEKGVWKIIMDSDSSEGGTINDKDFLFARPIE